MCRGSPSEYNQVALTNWDRIDQGPNRLPGRLRSHRQVGSVRQSCPEVSDRPAEGLLRAVCKESDDQGKHRPDHPTTVPRSSSLVALVAPDGLSVINR